MTIVPWLLLVVVLSGIGWVIYKSSRAAPRAVIWPSEHGRIMRWHRARGQYNAERRPSSAEIELHRGELHALEVQREHRLALAFDARASVVPRLDPARFPDAPDRSGLSHSAAHRSLARRDGAPAALRYASFSIRGKR
ncbi:MAG TPA: hypothetical protein VLE97_01680 [Gaiellaceae bacterium]|nr:hypothetical protein [Gaiellaceae bacterium]